MSLDYLVYIFSFGLLLGIVLITILSLAGKFLYFELLTHLKLQLMLSSLVCLSVFLMFESWIPFRLAFFCFLFHLIYLIPYYVQSVARRSTVCDLKLMQVNVLFSSSNYESVLAAIRKADPDVLVLQEINEEWRPHVIELEARYMFHKVVPQPRGAGMALYSRKILKQIDVLQLDDSTHFALKATIPIKGHEAMLLALHPTTPVTKWKFHNRNRQFHNAVRLLKKIEGPKIVIGDLNTTAWSPHFRKFIRDSGLTDTRKGFGLKTTWPMPLPAFLRIPIDHCLVSSEISPVAIRTLSTGSDHRSLIVDLKIATNEIV